MDNIGSVSSKRSALRFAGFDRPLTFKTDYEDGVARLVNISTNGCAIGNCSLELEPGEKILLAIELDSPSAPLSIRALVVRAHDGQYGLEFHYLDEAVKKRLFRFFAKETRRRKTENM